MPYTLLSGDPRAVGTGNPPVDMNNVNDVLAGMGAVFNPVNTAYSGGADPTGVADSTAAFQAVITAATAVSGEVMIPAGTYNLNTAGINLTGPVKIRGRGSGTGDGTPVPGVVFNCNGNGGSASLFLFPWQGYLWGGLEMSGIGINYTGGGSVFQNGPTQDSVFRDMLITLTASGSTVILCNGTNSCLNNLFERFNITTTAPLRTVPMVSVASSASGAISNNTFFKCKFSNLGNDITQYMLYFACTAAGGGYHYGDNIRECWFERAFGGCYQSLSGSNVIIDGNIVWDVFGNQNIGTVTVAAGSNGGTISTIASWATPSAGVLAVSGSPAAQYPPTGTIYVTTSGTVGKVTYTGISGSTFTGCAYVSGTGTVSTGAAVVWKPVVSNSLYYIGAYAGNSGSQGTRITGCGRNRNGPDGISTWDVFCDALTSQSQVDGYAIKSDTVSTMTNAFFNFSGHVDVVMSNNVSPQGAAVNGNSTTVITNPGTPTYMLGANSVHQAPTLLRGVAGQTAETFERVLATATCSVLASGTLYCASIPMYMGTLVTNLNFVTDATAKTGGTHGWYVLMDKNMKVLGVTADQTDAATVWGTISTPYPLAVTVPFIIPATTFYYIGVMVAETAGTMPTFAGATPVKPGVLGTTAGLCGLSSTGQTTPPAVAATMTALTASSGYSFYAYTT